MIIEFEDEEIYWLIGFLSFALATLDPESEDGKKILEKLRRS